MIKYFDAMEVMNVPWDFIIRLLLAAILGGFIGYERESHSKQAGLKTHILVCIGAALIMIVSQYGFFAVLETNVRVDPSRIAAQVVSGIGFLGGGIILKENGAIKGLSTAAGIWCVAGVGLAMGCGLYLLSVCATILILLVFEFLSRFSKKFYSKQLEIQIKAKGENHLKFRQILNENNAKVLSVKVNRVDDESNLATYKFKIKTSEEAKKIINSAVEIKDIILEYFEIV